VPAEAGDHVVSARALFGSCRWVVETLLPQYGIESTLVDGRDLANFEAASGPTPRCSFLKARPIRRWKSSTSPACRKLANQIGAKLVVDNVFATPLMQKPLELGAHVVCYSRPSISTARAAAWVASCCRARTGSTSTCTTTSATPARRCRRSMPGPCSRGLKPCRCGSPADRQCRPSADFLADHPAIAKVIYPGRADHPQADVCARQMKGGSTLVAFELKGGKSAAFSMQNALEVVRISNNLGDSKSLITHPATTTHKNLSEEARDELGIGPGVVRLSVGIEDVEDLVEDFDRALSGL
jgi:O-succinylhomoserine sulfhydrylase